MQSEIRWLDGKGATAPQGFVAGVARAGIKTEGLDLALLVAPPGSTCAAVFTTNQVKAAPVLVSSEHLASGNARAVIVNAGNANCCTGAQGMENARKMATLAAQILDARSDEVLVCSTGIIGHQLPMPKIENALAKMGFTASDEQCARAFMTTDLVPKFVAAQVEIGGKTVTFGGQAKGVGMIGPQMAPLVPHATMLAFLTTDAKIDAVTLQKTLEKVAERTFNSVTVDGDTSTNDTALIFASGASGVEISKTNLAEFEAALQAVCVQLAQKIARDGEGATKIIEIHVTGALDEPGAQKIALTIANSPLVKTAIFGNDPNWGRIAMAAGRAGVEFEPEFLSFSLAGFPMFRNGEPIAFDAVAATQALKTDFVKIELEIGQGSASWTAWTCDFSYDYVKINAEYHT